MTTALLHRVLGRVDALVSRAVARTHLWSVDSLGVRARISGRPVIVNRGHVTIGEDFRLSSHPACSHLVVERGARVVIGDGVSIASGACITCSRELRIGDGVSIGRNVMILDTDFHATGSMSSPGSSASIVIDDGARLEDEVVVLKGSSIGRGARIAARSVVSGVVPADGFAAGVPARVCSVTSSVGDVASRVRAVVDREVVDGDVPDSLAMLRLLLAVEEELGRPLPDDVLAGVTSREQIVDAILGAA